MTEQTKVILGALGFFLVLGLVGSSEIDAFLRLERIASASPSPSVDNLEIRKLRAEVAALQREVTMLREQRAPKCMEDETLLLGSGQFENGRWSDYYCTHPDDYVSGYIENEYKNPAVYSTVRGSVCFHPRFWKREVGIQASVSETCAHFSGPPTPLGGSNDE